MTERRIGFWCGIVVSAALALFVWFIISGVIPSRASASVPEALLEGFGNILLVTVFGFALREGACGPDQPFQDKVNQGEDDA